jgi:hypothetical protein
VTVELLCEGFCNAQQVQAHEVGPFQGRSVRHTLHVELAPVVNAETNTRRRVFQCVECGWTRTWGVEDLQSGSEAS